MYSRRIPAQLLTRGEFDPFGEVVRHDGRSGRNFVSAAVERTLADDCARVWVNHVMPTSQIPFCVHQLERHPHSAQTLIPLDVSRWLIVVAPTAADGGPDTDNIKAFMARPGEGITYRINTWHHGTIVFDRPAQFVVFMWRTDVDDDENWPITGDVLIDLPAPKVYASTNRHR